MRNICLFLAFLLIFGVVETNVYADSQSNVNSFIVTFKNNEKLSKSGFKESIEKSFKKISIKVNQEFQYESSRIYSNGSVVVFVPGYTLGKIVKTMLLIEKIQDVKYVTLNYNVYILN